MLVAATTDEGTAQEGGHSGMDIILYRGNANKLAARILMALMTEADVKLLDF